MEEENFRMMIHSIEHMIKKILDISLPWIKNINNQKYFIDPIDNKEISAHYGATHMAAALILYGDMCRNKALSNIGYELLESILNRWNQCKVLPGFHNDFNNFALCVIWNFLDQKKHTNNLMNRIRKIVLDTADSNNPTVNWFPMRWYVNHFRYKWSSDEKYKNRCDKCKNMIQEATYMDGFIDDRLPKGISFNLQYDVATVAVLQFLKTAGIQYDISGELGALLQSVAPDGDINYLGRGTNQIFAWGLWIFLLVSSGKNEALNVAVNYLGNRLAAMLKNNNMMLNDYRGEEKYLWWDYHYCSVYTAHLLFWLILAIKYGNSFPVKEKNFTLSDSGVHIHKTLEYFVVTFDGRKEYLAEKGPVLAALWTKSLGMVCKGNFGPWQGHFGNLYAPQNVVLFNNVGLMSVKGNKDFQKNRYMHKLLPNINTSASVTIIPNFTPMNVKDNPQYIEITWMSSGENIFSIPLINPIEESAISLFVDDKKFVLHNFMNIRNQYGWVHIMQSAKRGGKIWKLVVKK